ncbi:hypothetical protein [Candidatus Poriferisodalis sp.]
MGTTFGYLAVSSIGAGLAVAGQFEWAAAVLAIGIFGVTAFSRR